MEQGFLEVSNGSICFRKFGNGNEMLIALHGFANDGTVFQKFRHPRFTIYAIDLPFHGETTWRSDHYGKEDLLEIINALVQLDGRTKFYLLGHSLGGRYALSVLDELKGSLAGLYLLAPDGLPNGWSFLTEPLPFTFRKWLKNRLSSSGPFLRIVRGMRRMQLIGPFADAYLHHHLRTEKRRRRLFNTWLSTIHFRISPERIMEVIGKIHLPVCIVVGSRDELVSSEAWRQLAQGLPSARFHVLEKGHRLIEEDTARAIFTTSLSNP